MMLNHLKKHFIRVSTGDYGVRVFSTKVPIGDTIFTRDGTAILRCHPSHEKV